jgi:hypothetical protein
MSNIPSLEALHNNRDALLLAEVAAWLHDMGKCADEHIINQASDKPQGYAYSYKTAQSHRLPSGLPDVCLMNETISVKDLIEQGMPRVISDASKPWLLRSLGRCHSAAHVEKELSERETSTKQPKDNTRLSTAFGFEGNPVTGLINALSRLPFNSMQNRARFIPQVEMTFDTALGDTRRPINEVTLADWSGAVAALYKSASAGVLLGNKPSNPDDLQWRLLRVNFDVLGLYAKAVKIGDLLAYQRAVEQACEAVKKLVEEEYPLGNEIYRDSTGIYFTFPDLDLPAGLAQEIRRRVEAVEMELAPRIAVTVGDGNTATEQLKSILGKARKDAVEELKRPFDSQHMSAYWQQQWQTTDQGNWEVCPVCGLRPKREEREGCETCENRRKGRMQDWLQALNNPAQPQPTIWTNEVADKNGRLALLVGKFDLENWLSGDLVQTMLVEVEQNKPGECTPKNPSPARLRRIWETTQRFWETALHEKDSKGNSLLPAAPPRLLLSVKKEPGAPDLEEQPICELLVQGFKLSVVWDGGRFIVCDNPDYFQETTGQSLEEVLRPGTSFPLFTSEGYKKQDQKIGEFTIEKIERSTSYLPAIPILAEPQIFMALVPADRALKVVKAIKQKYEREMGKVQNRLPLRLGVVFASRRMPLQAILDAGRAMLQRSVTSEQWTVTSNHTYGKSNAPALNNPAHSEKWQEVRLKNAVGREITLPVSIVMGDGSTEDVWYPYWRVKGKPTDRARWFTGTDGEHWVHVCDLRQGDEVAFTPSTFDFEFLDTAARRFEVYYDENGRRPRRTRPLYLQDVERLEKLWEEHFSLLKRSQFSQMLQTIEAARERWNIPGGDEALQNEVFCQFVKDTLTNAKIPSLRAERSSPPLAPEIALPAAARNDIPTPLIEAATRGELADWAEIHLEILKEKMKGEQP